MQETDPEASRRKFAKEVEGLRAMEATLIQRGWWIMRAEFPKVKVAFATVNLRPRMIPFAVVADFSDYDVRPLAITFEDPFEDRELLPMEMMTDLKRRLPLAPGPADANAAPVVIQVAPLYQSYPHMPGSPGFLCLPGTRAYHDHNAHSGDPWELHRAGGEGRLFALLEVIWRYGSAPLDQMAINVSFSQTAVPE